MKALAQRTMQEGIAHHLKNPVRVYSSDDLQRKRIANTRAMVDKAMIFASNSNTRQFPRRMFEVGCGTADISGYLAATVAGWHAYGIDCHGGDLMEAVLRYAPHFTPIHLGIAPIQDGPVIEVVILSEVLEHLNDAEEVAKTWLRRARTSVISHPLEEPDGSILSGGDHCWSFTREDHERFFALGEHTIDETEVFEIGAYRIILSRGHKNGN